MCGGGKKRQIEFAQHEDVPSLKLPINPVRWCGNLGQDVDHLT